MSTRGPIDAIAELLGRAAWHASAAQGLRKRAEALMHDATAAIAKAEEREDEARRMETLAAHWRQEGVQGVEPEATDAS